MRFFIGILFIAIGLFLIIKTRIIIQNFGHIPWADRVMGGGGGTYALYKLVGFAAIFFALMYMTGKLQGLLLRFIGPLFGQ